MGLGLETGLVIGLGLGLGLVQCTLARIYSSSSASEVTAVPICRKTKVAQPSASWRCGGSCQRQAMPQAAASVGQPRPSSGSVHAGRPHRPCFRPKGRARPYLLAAHVVEGLYIHIWWFEAARRRGGCAYTNTSYAYAYIHIWYIPPRRRGGERGVCLREASQRPGPPRRNQATAAAAPVDLYCRARHGRGTPVVQRYSGRSCLS